MSKCSQPIRLQDSLKYTSSKKKRGIKLIFCILHVDIASKFSISLYYYIWCSSPGMPKVPEITVLQYPCRTLRKGQRINLSFCMKISIKVFYKLIPSSLVVIARNYGQYIQNNKFELSLQIFKKEVRYKLDFFFTQISIKISYRLILSILMGMVTHVQSIQNIKFAKSL